MEVDVVLRQPSIQLDIVFDSSEEDDSPYQGIYIGEDTAVTDDSYCNINLGEITVNSSEADTLISGYYLFEDVICNSGQHSQHKRHCDTSQCFNDFGFYGTIIIVQENEA